MNIPFVNWFWNQDRKKKDIALSLRSEDLYGRTKRFNDINDEYEDRLRYFETTLSPEQRSAYMDLKVCANRVILAKNSMDDAMESIDWIKKISN